jgi:hypothetical protein
MKSMSRCTCLVLALAACGRVGFEGGGSASVDAGHGGDAAMSTIDAPSVLGSVTCDIDRTAIADTDGIEIVVEGSASPMLAWRTTTGGLRVALLDATNGVTNVQTLFPGTPITRIAGAHPIANGHALAVEYNDREMLYSISPALTLATLRGMGAPGVGRGSVTGFGGYVFWGHVGVGSARAMLFDQLDADGNPTPRTNRTAATDVRDIVLGGATDSHAHLVWSEANDTCVASELFGALPDLVDVKLLIGCRDPRNASGVGDSIVTTYTTPTGALRMYTISPQYEHDIELSPAGRNAALADDGDVVWGTWFDDRVGGALVLAKIELDTTGVTVTTRQLDAVTPAGPAAIALVGDASPSRLVVLESGAIAVVSPCL